MLPSIVATLILVSACVVAVPALAGEVDASKGHLQEAAATEPVTLVVHTAKDCPVCKVWRESPSGLETALRIAKEWPALKLVVIVRTSLNGSETESLYPSDLQSLYQARRERYQLSPAVPLFELVRQGKVISRRAGLPGWSVGTVAEVQALRESARR
jgi:tRNA A37 threonylcarbamoyladenosine synthetase subunit TsaC/SUA5/YrdC